MPIRVPSLFFPLGIALVAFLIATHVLVTFFVRLQAQSFSLQKKKSFLHILHYFLTIYLFQINSTEFDDFSPCISCYFYVTKITTVSGYY